MTFTAVASVLFNAAEHTSEMLWLPDALGAPEPIWLALWGLALIRFSTGLRNRRNAPQVAESRAQVPVDLKPITAARTA